MESLNKYLPIMKDAKEVFMVNGGKEGGGVNPFKIFYAYNNY